MLYLIILSPSEFNCGAKLFGNIFSTEIFIEIFLRKRIYPAKLFSAALLCLRKIFAKLLGGNFVK